MKTKIKIDGVNNGVTKCHIVGRPGQVILIDNPHLGKVGDVVNVDEFHLVCPIDNGSHELFSKFCGERD